MDSIKRSRNSQDSSPQSPTRPNKRSKDEGLEFINPKNYYSNYASVETRLRKKCHELVETYALQRDGPPSTSGELAYLLVALSKIVNKPRDTKAKPLDDFKSFVAENMEPLRSWILTCVPVKEAKAGDGGQGGSERWMDLLKLKDLYVGPPENHIIHEDLSTPHRSDMQTVLKTAWEGQYYGEKALTTFIRNLDQIQRKAYYCNTVPVIQSSGAGKSRMLWEASRHILALPFSIAPESGGSLIYPSQDTEVHDYLLKRFSGSSDPAIELEIRYYRFFISLFEAAKDKIAKCNLGKETYLHLAEAWREHLAPKVEGEGSIRNSLYNTVIENTKDEKKWQDPASRLPQTVHALKEHMVTRLRELVDSFKHKRDPYTYVLNGKRTSVPEPVQLLIYFDEAQSLAQYVQTRLRPTYYHVFLRCINVWASKCADVMVVFLSTHTKLHDLAPSAEYVASDRYGENRHLLPAPIVETPFDCSPQFPLRGGASLDEVTSLEYIAQFGRPLWWSLLKAANADDGTKPIGHELLHLARNKLLGVRNASETSWSLATLPSCAAASAVLDMLLNLDFGYAGAALQRQLELVQGHLRLMYSVLQSREYAYTGVSSEPVVAEAALYQLWFWTMKHQMTTLRAILEANIALAPPTLIDLGQRGEVVARALIMQAYIRAVCAEHTTDPDGVELFFTKGCSLIGFLKELFCEEHVEKILESVPSGSSAGSNPIPFRKAFEHSWVRITHFVRAGDDSAATAPAMMAAFLRGMAVIGHPTQVHVDFMLPILLNKNFPVTSTNISAIMWQIKSRKDPMASNVLDFSEEQLRFFSGRDDSGTEKYPITMPYIVIASELGLYRNNTHYRAPPTLSTVIRASTPAPQARSGETKEPETPSKVILHPSVKTSYRKTKGNVHPKYMIIARGCSENIYKVISPEEREGYNKLLRTKPFLHDHPRQETIDEVYKLKPVWYAQKSYDWFEDGIPGIEEVDEDDKRPDLVEAGEDDLMRLANDESGDIV